MLFRPFITQQEDLTDNGELARDNFDSGTSYSNIADKPSPPSLWTRWYSTTPRNIAEYSTGGAYSTTNQADANYFWNSSDFTSGRQWAQIVLRDNAPTPVTAPHQYMLTLHQTGTIDTTTITHLRLNMMYNNFSVSKFVNGGQTTYRTEIAHNLTYPFYVRFEADITAGDLRFYGGDAFNNMSLIWSTTNIASIKTTPIGKPGIVINRNLANAYIIRGNEWSAGEY